MENSPRLRVGMAFYSLSLSIFLIFLRDMCGFWLVYHRRQWEYVAVGVMGSEGKEVMTSLTGHFSTRKRGTTKEQALIKRRVI